MTVLQTVDGRLLPAGVPPEQSEYLVISGGHGRVELAGALQATYELIYESNPNCVPWSAEILTRRGWLGPTDVRVGDETLGFNGETGRSEWTPISRVHHVDDAALVELSNNSWRARATPDHRWRTEGGYATTERLARTDRLVLAAPADGGESDLSPTEAAVIAWLLTDGHIRRGPGRRRHLSGEQVAEIHRGEQTGRQMAQRFGVSEQLVCDVRKGRAYVRPDWRPKKFEATIAQSKPEGLAAIRHLLKAVPHVERPPTSRGIVTFALSAGYARAVWARARLDERSIESLVCEMSREARRAWLDAVITAEGSRRVGRGATVTQKRGPVLEAIITAAYLEGHRPSLSWRYGSTTNPTGVYGVVALNRRVIRGASVRRRDVGRGRAWCVTTELGTWTMRDDAGVPMLTGNCAAVVNKLVRQIATLPIRTYDRPPGEPNPECVPNHPVAKLLAHPAPRKGASYWKQGLARSALVQGNGLLAKWRGPSGVGLPQALLPCSWPYVAAYAPLGSPVEWWSTFQTGTQRFFNVDDGVHFAWESADLHGLGISPLKQLALTVKMDDATRRYQNASFVNGARPAGAVIPPAGFTYKEGQREQFRREIQNQHGGVDNAFMMALLAPGFTWQPFSHTAVEAELIAARTLNREEFAMVYDIPPPMIGDLTHGTYCLPADAMVQTERGALPIVDVRAGDRVWSMTGEGLELRPVEWSGQTGVKPLLTIRTQNRTLRCTANHPVRVARHIDRRSAAQRGGPAYSHEWVPAGQIKVGDILMTATSLPIAGVRRCPTREDVSVGFAEFCGLMLGDGSIDLKRGAVSVARGAGARYMDYYRDVMRREFLASDGARGVASHPVALKERERDTRFVSRSAADELHALGITGTAFTKRVPEWVHALAPDLRAAFLRGFAEADGSVDKQGRLAIHSANERLLRELRELCIGLGVPVTNFRAQRGWVTLPNGERFYSVMWSFLCSDPGVNAAVIGSHDPQDARRMADGQPWGAKIYSYPRRGGGCPPTPAHCGHAKVVSIEQGDVSVPVYDLTVPGTHNFIAEGVVVHNSNVEQLHRILYVTTLRPWLALIEEIMQVQLIEAEDGWNDIYVQFDLTTVLRGNRREEIDAASEAFTNGLMTLNEVRELLELPRLSGEVDPEGMADVPHIPANNLKPLGYKDPPTAVAGEDPDETIAPTKMTPPPTDRAMNDVPSAGESM